MKPAQEETPEVTDASGREHPNYLNVTESSMQKALIEARGDIFIASQLLGITAVRLDRAMAVSPTLQETRAEARKSFGKESVSEDEIRAAVERRIALYRVAGLDALHDLATMPLDENSAQNQVKLAAAARLAGPSDAQTAGGDFASILRELNESYQQNAPRLRVTRERISVEVAPAERIVGQGTPE